MTSDGGPRDREQTDWETLLRVWMHDPPDKALDVRRHVSRAERYLSVALGLGDRLAETKDRDAGLADQLAAIAERLPMPSAGARGERAVGPENGRLHIRHPLSAQDEILDCPDIDERQMCVVIDEIVRDLVKPRDRFLALWRMLPERIDFPLNRLPADTRVPDHSLIDHADITAGLWSSIEKGAAGRAIFGFALGPVQPFIEAARSLRDLWTGSVILSCVAFAAMRPILERFGPTAFVYPALRGNPLMDLWLRNDAGLHCVAKPDGDALCNPSLPHRFVALVPLGREGAVARELTQACKAAAAEEWRSLSTHVRDELAGKLGEDFIGWDRLWDGQCGAFFKFHETAVPERELDDDALAQWLGKKRFADVWPDAGKIRRLHDADRPGYTQISSGRWQAQLDVSARIMEADRMIRHIPEMPAFADTGSVPQKCSLFGSFEQMGPAEFSQARNFWEQVTDRWRVDGVRLRKKEKFCSVALTKRFAMPVSLAKRLHLDDRRLRFPDTATIAAANWLGNAKIDPGEYHPWNGRWLHDSDDALNADGEERAPDSFHEALKDATKKCGQPPIYFAILMMDGDELGGWLHGEKSPKVRDVMHPALNSWFDSLDDETVRQALNASRPVGPALHAAISGALGRFASRLAPDIVERYKGRVIYSGGDDLLAVPPAANAVACARKLRDAYRDGSGPQEPGMGSRATISAGLAYVHYKEDLRLGLQAAREAERRAKDMGRDALGLQFMRRSGEHADALLGWQDTEWFGELTGLFAKGASNRWAYRLRAELPVLAVPDMPEELVAAEIRRLGDRTDDRDIWSGGTDSRPPGERIAGWWRRYREDRRVRIIGQGNPAHAGEWLRDFTTLCQGAAFVARGRDD